MTAAAAVTALPLVRTRPPLPPSSAPQQQQQQPITASQVHRLLIALSGQVTELTGRVDLGELQQEELLKELARMEVRLATKADRRLTVLDRFAQQPVPEITVDEWLAECDVGVWMDELYGGDLEMLASIKPAVALTRVLEAYVSATWPDVDDAVEAAAAAAPRPLPPIRGMMVGRSRSLYWFLATNWGAASVQQQQQPPPHRSEQQQVMTTMMDGNASILLCAASVAPAGSVMVDADAMSDITDDGPNRATPRTPHNNYYGTAAATPRAGGVTPRAMSVVAQQHLVPLEGVWHRMDIKKHWANIVTVLFQRYGEYMDRVSVRATKDQQLVLLTSRAKCCNATERAKMRVAFYDAIAKIPGAILV